jgi:hypothetical protein
MEAYQPRESKMAYKILNQSDEVLATAQTEDEARFRCEVLLFGQRFTRFVWVGPCGCEGCDKWSDCDYCGECNPDL